MNSIYVCEEDNVGFIKVELPGVVVHSVYTPPAEQFLLPPHGSRTMPHIVIGDFNSHNTLWGYTSTDNDGKAVDMWVQSIYHSYIMRSCRNHSTLLYRRKGTSRTSYLHRQTFRICVRSLFSIQHRSNLCQCKPSNRCTTTFSRRFNLKKAAWKRF